MKATELMIGDWVHCETLGEKIIEKVSEITRTRNNELKIGVVHANIPYSFLEKYIEPITLTSNILDKNFRGRKVKGVSFPIFDYFLDKEEQDYIRISAYSIYLCKAYDDSEHGAHDDVYITELKYVHELQHALRFYGIDKEIKLED